MNKRILSYSLICFMFLTGCCGNPLKKKAESGDAEAQYMFAKELEKENKENKDNKDNNEKEILEWLEKSANGNYPKAIGELALKYFEAGDNKKAIELAKKSENINTDIGKSVLAYYYYFGGYECPMNRPRALELANETSNEPLSKAILASFYSTGFWGIEKDLTKAKQLAEESIKDGCVVGRAILFRIILEYLYTIRNIYEDSKAINKMPYYSEKEKQCFIVEHRTVGKMLAEIKREMSKSIYGKKISDQTEKTNNLSNSLASYFSKDKPKDRDNNKKDLRKGVVVARIGGKTIKVGDSEAPEENINWDERIKTEADNGSPAFMYIYAEKQKDKNEQKKYMEQAEKMGLELFIESMYEYAPKALSEKWLNIGVKLNNKRCLGDMAKAYFKGKLLDKEISPEFDKGLDILEQMLMNGQLSGINDLTLVHVLRRHNPLKIDNMEEVIKKYLEDNKDEINPGFDIDDDMGEFGSGIYEDTKKDIELNSDQMKRLYIIGKVSKHSLVEVLYKEIENRFSKQELENMNKIIEEKSAKVKENIVLRDNKMRKYMALDDYYRR